MELIKRGKKLSYLLRHDKSYAFDEHGWREVSDLVANHAFTMEELREIVATNNKQRYEFSEDMTRIRARQGHSIQVDVELAEATPPVILYHGTAKAFIGSIMKQGILKAMASPIRSKYSIVRISSQKVLDAILCCQKNVFLTTKV